MHVNALMKRFLDENDGDGNDLPGSFKPSDAAARGDLPAEPTKVDTKSEDVKIAAEDIKTDDAKADEAKADEDKARDDKGRFAKKEDSPMVPKARFDEAVEKERAARIAAEQRLAEMEAKIGKADVAADIEKIETEVQGLEKEYSKLMLEGASDKAAEVMKSIRHKEREIVRLEQKQTESVRDQERAQEQAVEAERARVNEVVAELQAAHPELNEEDAESFNPKLVNLILAEQKRLMADEKLSPSAALRKAADDVMELRGKPAASLKDAKKDGEGKDVEAKRKAEATKKALEAANKQPASTKETGMDSDKHGAKTDGDVDKMSFEEFSALPEATKSKLRGDYV